ncbi:efflux RND transporter periplasmic adaptor subunit [Myxococcota bacterium]|nr:efflux RND transporter periplasmic adaptor subunit [Myxococcota bacterium]
MIARSPLPSFLRAALVGALLAAGAACGGSGAEEDAKEDEAPPKPAVRVQPAVLDAVTATLDGTSTVDAAVRADLAVEVAGTVREVRVEEGDRVARGQVLAVLDNPSLAGALRRAEAEIAQRRADEDRLRPLHEKGFVAQAEWDLAVRSREAAELALREAQDAFDAATVRAPIAGTVTARGVRTGENVAPPMVAFALADLDHLVVDVHLPERDLARLSPGMAARLVSETVGGEPVPAEVARLAPVVDPKTGTVKVTLAVAPGAAGPLRPGMLVRASIVSETRESAVLIPKKAVVYDEGRPFAWRAKEGKAERVALDLGFEDRDRVEVRAGIAPGDPIVVVGQAALKAGAEVDVVGPDGEPVPKPGKDDPAPPAAGSPGGTTEGAAAAG